MKTDARSIAARIVLIAVYVDFYPGQEVMETTGYKLKIKWYFWTYFFSQ